MSNKPLRKRLMDTFQVLFLVIVFVAGWMLADYWRAEAAEKRAAEVQLLENLDVEILEEPGIIQKYYILNAGSCTLEVEFEDDSLQVSGSDLNRDVTVPQDTSALSDVVGLRNCYK